MKKQQREKLTEENVSLNDVLNGQFRIIKSGGFDEQGKGGFVLTQNNSSIVFYSIDSVKDIITCLQEIVEKTKKKSKNVGDMHG